MSRFTAWTPRHGAREARSRRGGPLKCQGTMSAFKPYTRRGLSLLWVVCHVWTAPLRQALTGVVTIAVGCSHVSGLLVQPLPRLLALM